MNNWSDIQDLKKKKALLDEKWGEFFREYPKYEKLVEDMDYKYQPERKEDGDKKDSQVITRCSYRITEPTSL